MKCDAFRRAVEALDLDATVATFSPSIVLRSPVREEPLEGRQAVGRLFAVLFRVFEDPKFVGSFTPAMARRCCIFGGACGTGKAKAST
jgi:ketosteroid isomerase-like protein